MKLKVKLILFLISIILLTGTVIIWFSNIAVRKILIEEVAKRGHLKSSELQSSSVSAFTDGKEIQLLLLLQESMDRTGALYAMALDPNGLVMAHTNVVEKGKRYTDVMTLKSLKSDRPGYQEVTHEGKSVLEIWLPVWSVQKARSGEEFLLFGGDKIQEKTRLGTLRLGYPIKNVLETVDRISNQMFWIMIISGGGMLLVSILFIGSILKRIQILAEGTLRISKGDYGSLIPVLSRDELGQLTESFNNMSHDLAQVYGNLERQVKERTHELESFVYTISHDLKSPVVSMQGMASLFLNKYGNQIDEKGRHYLDRIVANTNYMEDLINDLLSLSRIGRKQENPEIVDLHDTLKEILAIHKERFREKGIEAVIVPSLPDFKYERGHLTHLFQNLITNAEKFMGDQPHPRIEIGGREEKDSIEFYVKDNGIGIDPNYFDKIFGVFHRLKEVTVEGTGVGLSIVKKIVDMGGGKIWLESQKGAGTTFFVKFPRN
ncbi:MAG: HAMP domain-containing protein [Nitrospirae bacterium]|nr:HAMP domain-containing protein [Nitrospirota bacterium]MBI3593861.1 HAMP domain-containing protein [Nitrospirota bacterium]